MEILELHSGKYKAIAARLEANTATLAQVLQYFQPTPEALTALKLIAAKAVIKDFYNNTTASRPYRSNTHRFA
jgi:hypothetical protein